MKNSEISFDEWVEEGYIRGWIGPPVCQTHDGIPLTPEEDSEFETGGDPCIHVVRLYEDESVKSEVEKNHEPSVWRALNRGLGSNE